jgi:hypothetical protein
MINDGRLLAIANSQKVLSIQRGEGIDAQFHVFRESQDAHFTPQTKCKKAIEMIAAQEPLDTIGGHCQKSPLKITTLPPKGEFGHCMMSRKVRSTTSA